MAEIVDFEALKVSLAAPDEMHSWSHGEVVKPETINYRTLRPEKDGLFDERIFGPTKDWECYCGKYKRIRYKGVICDKCGVEVTHSRVRRERMGHIQLASPVVHSWFFKGAPSKIGLILDLSPRNLESVVYYASYLVLEVDEKKREEIKKAILTELEQKKKEVQKKIEVEIKKLDQEIKAETKEIKKKIKVKDQAELKIEEKSLTIRGKIAQIRETQSQEIAKLEGFHNALVDLVFKIKAMDILSEEEYLKIQENNVQSFLKVGMGGEALLELLQKIDLSTLSAKLKQEAAKTSGQKHIRATKKLRLVEGMRKADIQPSWMIIKVLPVLPPDLRPMVQLSGGRFASSDLNDLYRRVINRNNRLKKLIDLGAPEIILRNEKRMLQESVDALIDVAARTPTRGRGSAVLRSLSDMLRGKQGRFRQNLLGKRVDYSGRSVIVVGPELALDEVGLPKEMALEMFKPFVLREIIGQGLAPNVKSGKNVLERRPPEVWDILEQITEGHPVLINRAPTLHRLGIQAFYPVLIDGDAIRIHPAICAGFNADFDGDQMAVHVPLSQKAKEEAQTLMMAKQNLLRPADGSPITLPNREMALGTYYSTMFDKEAKTAENVFSDPGEAILAFQSGKIPLRGPIKVRINQEVIETSMGRVLFNEALPKELQFINRVVTDGVLRDMIIKAFSILPEDGMANLIDELKVLGFWGATISGISMGLFDCKIIPDKEKILKSAEKEVGKIEDEFKKGFITEGEKKDLSNEIWSKTTNDLAEKTWEYLGPYNVVRMIVESGGRGSFDQVKQLTSMRGLVTDPSGKIVPLPTKSNFREGLSVFEYFTSSRGARKGLADRALKTAESGYLTRRLVDVAHDVIVRMEDCGTQEGMEDTKTERRATPFVQRILGRVLAADVKQPKGKKVLLKKGVEIDEEKAQLVDRSDVTEVLVRSPLTCRARYGICAACYGRDLATRKMVKIGTPVGVIAAQSIGEPGTQLTMRTFHLGGIIGLDITQGLPRVEELFEGRTPKVLAPLSEIAGRVKIEEMPEGYKITIKSVKIKPILEREYFVPRAAELKVSDGEMIPAGTPLSSGHLDIREIQQIKGLKAAQKYIADECQAVYEGQGVPINDKHFEAIVRKMCEKVRVESSGDTILLPGELVDKNKFEDENKRVLAEGGEPATAQVVLLGITRAALYTESFLSAASFQETTNVLSDAASEGKIDRLLGLKENVIIGRLIPTSPERARLNQESLTG